MIGLDEADPSARFDYDPGDADGPGLDALADMMRDERKANEWQREKAEEYYQELCVSAWELSQAVRKALTRHPVAEPTPDLIYLEAEATAFLDAEGWKLVNPGEAYRVGEEGWEPSTPLEWELTALEADLRRLRRRFGIARSLDVALRARWRRTMAASLLGTRRGAVVHRARRVARRARCGRNRRPRSHVDICRRAGPRRRHGARHCALSRSDRESGDHVAPYLLFGSSRPVGLAA